MTMQDQPTPRELLEGVIRFLRNTAVPHLEGRHAYDARIAASLLQTVQRQMARDHEDTQAERESLQRLLGSASANLDELQRTLCEQITTASMAWDDPRLLDHLWAVTLAKLAVDQPGYSTYRRLLERG
jgi:uncharacterized protein YigA (DUF484 family)